MQLTNCGLMALEKISTIKNISAFTLIHAARDNDLNLYFFKVNDLIDLPRVTRPAIFHQKDHFVVVKNGEPMPDGEYTGYVIGPAVLGRVIALSEAKFVTGGKNFFTGKNKDGEQTGHGALVDILAVVASIVTANPLTGAAIEAGGSAIERAQNPAQLGSPGNLGAIALDAAKGFAIGAGASGAAQGVTAGGGLNNGIGQAFSNAVKGGVQGEIQSFSHPISTAANGLSINTAGITGSTASQLGAFNAATGSANAAAPSSSALNAGSNAVNAFNASTPAMSLATGGVANAAGQAVNPIYQGAASSFTPNSGFSLSGLNLPASSGAAGAAGAAGAGKVATGGLSSLINPATVIGGAGSLLSKPPQVEGSAVGNYSAAKTFLGDSAYKQLTTPTSNQLLNYVQTPIADLQQQFTQNNKRTLDTINTAYDNQRQQLTHQYAQAGQNFANSSELQDKIGQLEQKRTNDLTLAQQELTDQALGQAIQVKQSALSSSLQQGQYDANTAMDLAKLTGDDQALQYAIANNDYQTFQNIMGKILTAGLPNQMPNQISLKLA